MQTALQHAAKDGSTPARELHEACVHILAQCGRDNARTTAEWLMADITGKSRLDIYADPHHVLTPGQYQQYAKAVERLVNGEPLAYIRGDVIFRNHRFMCDPRALIPRPETEQLVETVLQAKPLWDEAEPRIADVGTGSGCIVISLALERPAGAYAATDISPDALALARQNARMHDAERRIQWFHADTLEPFPPSSLHAVVSNPPYITEADYEKLPGSVRIHEPRQALCAGADGLAHLRKIVSQSWSTVRPGGYIFLEIGADQGRQARELLDRSGWQEIRIVQDWGGNDRIVVGVHP